MESRTVFERMIDFALLGFTQIQCFGQPHAKQGTTDTHSTGRPEARERATANSARRSCDSSFAIERDYTPNCAVRNQNGPLVNPAGRLLSFRACQPYARKTTSSVSAVGWPARYGANFGKRRF